MTAPFYVFIALVVLFVGGVAWFMASAWESIRTKAAEHATTYAVSYVKCTALIGITMGGAFKEQFEDLSMETAARMSWWGWAIMFWVPVSSGLAVLVAFLDRSVERANVKREEAKAQTANPFIQPQTPIR